MPLNKNLTGTHHYFSRICLVLFAIITTSSCFLELIGRMEIDRYATSKVEELTNCNQRSKLILEHVQVKHAFLYIKIPSLDDDYLKYDLERKAHRRRDRDIPIYIEFNGSLVNPRKQDFMNYEVSSKIKEQLILENSSIALKHCLYMALGSEYLIPIPAQRGLFSVILYLDVGQISGFYREKYYLLESRELVQDLSKDYRLKKIKHLDYFPSESIETTLFDKFIHRSLQTEFTFEHGKIYQLEIESNPHSSLPIGSYTESYKSKFFREKTVPGFTITLKELPPNTKFAFDGKDDIGKTYEQVKKEFILYDKDAEAKKE